MATDNQFSGKTTGYFFNLLRVLHFAILGGIVVFGVIVLFLLTPEEELVRADLKTFAQIFGSSVGLLTIVLAYFSPQWLIRKIDESSTLSNKLSQYYRIHIIKLALLEGGAIINIVLFYLVGNKMLLLLAGLSALIIAINSPSAFKVGNELKLKEEEIKTLGNPEEIIP